MPQLRFDDVRRAGQQVVVKYTHHATVAPPGEQGFGMAWESTADLLEQLDDLRRFLEQPEIMVLLAMMGRVNADRTVPNPGVLRGKKITFDPASLTSPLAVE